MPSCRGGGENRTNGRIFFLANCPVEVRLLPLQPFFVCVLSIKPCELFINVCRAFVFGVVRQWVDYFEVPFRNNNSTGPSLDSLKSTTCPCLFYNDYLAGQQ